MPHGSMTTTRNSDGVMIDFSYFSLYLKNYLTDAGDVRKDDDEFINARGDMAAEVFESERRSGSSAEQAQESAMAVLMEGFD
mgnify:CR=1 FL=1